MREGVVEALAGSGRTGVISVNQWQCVATAGNGGRGSLVIRTLTGNELTVSKALNPHMEGCKCSSIGGL
jgi:hypothetical protein